MEVQFLNLKGAYLELKQEFDQVWQEINADSFYILGRKLEQFEQEFAMYLGVKHVIGVANGLDALKLSLQVLNIGRGDEVIVPAFTYIASWLAISEIGARPVPIEVNSNFLLDPKLIEAAVTVKTKAIMPVHIYGRLCEMEEITNIAQKHGLKIVEDAAQAHGAYGISKSVKAGALGDCSGFSFYPGKNLGCFGDGGCISTNNDEVAEKLKLMRNYGSKERYEHEIISGNSRLDELQAGILSVKLKRLDEWNERRQKIAQLYLSELSGINELTLPTNHPGHVWHVFAVKTSKRKELQDYLASVGVGTNIHYPKAIHLQGAYQHMDLPEGSFPYTESINNEVISLPIGPHLTSEEAFYVAGKVRKFFTR